MLLNKISVFMLLLPATLALAQNSPPDTEVFLAPLKIGTAKTSLPNLPTIGAAINISASPGYDSQPSFLPNSSAVLFTSDRNGVNGKQTDIVQYDIASKQLQRLTKTPENEYSALVAADGLSFVTVHGSEQSLYRYDVDGANPRLAYQHGKALIGYHLWITPTSIAAFILGDKADNHTLQVIDTTTGTSVTIATNIGRSLLLRPGTGTVSFIDKSAGEKWMLKEFDIKTQVVMPIVEALPGSEDLTWLSDGSVLMGNRSKLYRWQQASSWAEVADFGAQGLSKISRLAASPDGKWLAIVAEQTK
jgi:dipeptidyl aminopeptidase/acylaminoacyl peptidase